MKISDLSKAPQYPDKVRAMLRGIPPCGSADHNRYGTAVDKTPYCDGCADRVLYVLFQTIILAVEKK